MERINGTILRRDVPEFGVNLNPERAGALGQTMIDGLAQLHKVDAQILSELSKGPGYTRAKGRFENIVMA